MKLSEKSEITFDLKFILLIAGGLLSLSATFFALKADIEEAKELPKMPMSSQEIKLKDELIRATILNIATEQENQQEQLNEIQNKLNTIDNRIYNLNK
jgi:hypothetical protein|tara:strand:+ start:153 stop:446 length:294 start_codon:yes stop_codon:yes gene_type:complete